MPSSNWQGAFCKRVVSKAKLQGQQRASQDLRKDVGIRELVYYAVEIELAIYRQNANTSESPNIVFPPCPPREVEGSRAKIPQHHLALSPAFTPSSTKDSTTAVSWQ